MTTAVKTDMKTEPTVYDWEAKLAEGKRGEQVVVSWFRARGMSVTDVSDDPDYQRIDTDLLVDGRTVELKYDAKARGNLFLEFQALNKSTADWWFFAVPHHNLVFRFRRSRLLKFVRDHTGDYRVHTVYSGDGARRWTVQGIAVPMMTLLVDAGGKVWRVPFPKAAKESKHVQPE